MDGENNDLSNITNQPSQSAIVEGVFWCTAYLLEALLITSLNALIIMVFVKYGRLHKKPFYLPVNLAIADLLIGSIFIPLWVYYFGGLSIGWNLPQGGDLPMVMEIVEALANFVSLLTLVAIALERMYAVIWPFRSDSTSHRTYFIVIALVWVVSAIGVTAIMVTARMWASRSPIVLVFIGSISILTITTAYSSIAIQMICKNIDASCKKEDRRLTLTLFFVTAVAIITWIPYIVTFFVSVSPKNRRIFQIFNYSNALINPLLYTLRTAEFRHAVHKLICRKRPTRD